MPGVTVESADNMSGPQSKPSSESGAAAPGFSYAQAAKGRAIVPSVSAQPSPTTSSSDTPNTTAPTSTTDASSVSGQSSAPQEDDHRKGSVEEAVIVREGLNSDVTKRPVEATASLPSPALADNTVTSLQKEPDQPLPPHLAETSWRSARPKVSHDPSSEGTERRSRPKKGKKEKTAEKDIADGKEKEELRPELFVAAPPPSFNIWQQRREAAAAKAPSTVSPLAATSESVISDASHDQASKQAESKKKGRPSSSDGTTIANAQPSKSSKRSPDAAGKKEGSNRSAPRGQRSGEKDEIAAATQPPPPVEDAVSWPTPEIAVEEDKRQAQEKVVKADIEDNSVEKPRVKKHEWVTVPFVPSVTFNTALPSRGGRGRGGGRGGRETSTRGHGASESLGGEKSSITGAVDPSGVQAHEGVKEGDSAYRATSQPPSASRKVGAADGSGAVREQRKISATYEKSKVDPFVPGQKTDGRQSRRESIQAGDSSNSFPPGHTQLNNDQNVSTPTDQHFQTRFNNGERKVDASMRVAEHFNGNGISVVRDRGDNRGGRGGRGGRAGYNNFTNGQAPYINGHGQQIANGYSFNRQNSVPYSPPSQQNQQYVNNYAQNGKTRGAPRAHSIPNGVPPMYNGYPRAGPNVLQINPVQGFDYQGHPMTQFVDYSVLPMVIMQMDYYFSIDNLCKDVFLRKHMDSQGFVFLHFIAGFKRISSLTPDIEVLRIACQESDIIEIVTGSDGIDRVRRQDGWEQWVMPLEDRDEGARHAGPAQFHRQHSYVQQQQINHQRALAAGQAMSPSFILNGGEPSFRPYASAHPTPIVNGTTHNEFNHHVDAPLSAAVPDFNPSAATTEKIPFSSSEITFRDAEIAGLMLAWQVKTPHHTAASRTFSNGSIDAEVVTTEVNGTVKPTSSVNGAVSSEGSPERSRRARSPGTVLGEQSPTSQTFANPPPVLWTKGQSAPVALKDNANMESYSHVLAKALHARQSSAGTGEVNYDLKVLYDFWPHFLVRNFNPRMYEEFRTLATEDAKQNPHGINGLISFYDEVLSKPQTINDTIARHYVELVQAESDRSSTDRPAFAKLRSAWRNGALDLKSRKKVADMLDVNIREELER